MPYSLRSVALSRATSFDCDDYFIVAGFSDAHPLRHFHEAVWLPSFGDDDGSHRSSSDKSRDENGAWRDLMTVRLQHNNRHERYNKSGQSRHEP